MTPDELRICNVVDTLIRKNRSFALWRIPGESPRFAMQTSGSAHPAEIGRVVSSLLPSM